MACSTDQMERTLKLYPMLKRLVERDDWDSRFLGSVRRQLMSTGTLTPRQALQACKIIGEEKVKKAYLERAKQVEISIPEGWTTVTGIVTTVKWKVSRYHMMLQTFDGYRTWGSIPGFIFLEYENDLDKLRGQVLTLEMNLIPKGEDFAVYNDVRPALRKAESSSV